LTINVILEKHVKAAIFFKIMTQDFLSKNLIDNQLIIGGMLTPQWKKWEKEKDGKNT